MQESRETDRGANPGSDLGPGTEEERPGMLTGRSRSWLLCLVDAVLACFALWIAFQLRFDQPSVHLGQWPAAAAVLVVARLASNLYFRLHRWSFKFSSLRDGARVALAGLVGTMLFVLLSYFALRSIGQDVPARGVVVLEMLLSTAMMGAVRFAPRLAWTYRADLWGRRRGERTLIVGAGASGEMLLRDLQRGEGLGLHVVGFVDDDSRKWGHIVGGKPVLGGVETLPAQVRALRVSLVVIAIPGLEPERLRHILSLGFAEKVRFKILPVSYGFLQDRDPAEALRDLSTEDLLARPELTFGHDQGEPNLDPEGVQLVAGAAGSIGSEVCRQLLELGCRRLVMVDTDENGLYVLRRRFERQYAGREIVAEVADIRDVRRLESLFGSHRPRDVFHAAARKHVPLMEMAPGEAVKTNVFGTQNLIEVAEAFGVDRFVFTSTDKAVRPTSIMGATKRLGELLVQRHDLGSDRSFSVVRFGNVLGSAGSVVPLFREQIAAGGPVTVTHPEIQRYFMTISEAVGLVLKAAYGDHGSLCVLEMGEPIRIVDLARQMITMAGLVPEVDIPILVTGLRPGEKLFEEVLAEGERVVRQVDRKIRVVEGPAARQDVEILLAELRTAVDAENPAAVQALLHRLVPDYRVPGRVEEPPRPSTEPSTEGDADEAPVVM